MPESVTFDRIFEYLLAALKVILSIFGVKFEEDEEENTEAEA